MRSIRFHHIRNQICTALIVAAVLPPLVAAVPALALTAPVGPVQTHHLVTAPGSVAFSFGREGGFILPLRVSIYDDGTVRVQRPNSPTGSQIHLSKDTLDGLLKLADAEGFFALPGQMIGRGNPDVGGRFISIHTTTGTKTVHLRYVHNTPFDQIYAVLMAVAVPGTMA